jgi:ankyrin repeat protein
MKLLLILSVLISFGNSFAGENLTNKKKLNDMVIRASKENNIRLVKEYVKHGGSLNIKNEKGYTPLILAAYYGHREMVNLLLKSGARPCEKDHKGNTALMGAIFKGYLTISYDLMNSDCDVDTKNKSDQTALMYASLFGREELVKNLINKGASIHAKDINGNDSVSLAKKQYNHKMVEILKE